jgi:hypothetical protein
MTDTWTDLQDVADVTEEILSAVESVIDGWYSTGRIDWEDVWDRVEGTRLANGTRLTFSELDSPAQRKIKRQVKKRRAEC